MVFMLWSFIAVVLATKAISVDYEALVVSGNMTSSFLGLYLPRDALSCGRRAYLHTTTGSLIHSVQDNWAITSSGYNTVTSCSEGLGFNYVPRSSCRNFEDVLSCSGWISAVNIVEVCPIPSLTDFISTFTPPSGYVNLTGTVTVTCQVGVVKVMSCQAGNIYNPGVNEICLARSWEPVKRSKTLLAWHPTRTPILQVETLNNLTTTEEARIKFYNEDEDSVGRIDLQLSQTNTQTNTSSWWVRFCRQGYGFTNFESIPSASSYTLVWEFHWFERGLQIRCNDILYLDLTKPGVCDKADWDRAYSTWRETGALLWFYWEDKSFLRYRLATIKPSSWEPVKDTKILLIPWHPTRTPILQVETLNNKTASQFTGLKFYNEDEVLVGMIYLHLLHKGTPYWMITYCFDYTDLELPLPSSDTLVWEFHWFERGLKIRCNGVLYLDLTKPGACDNADWDRRYSTWRKTGALLWFHWEDTASLRYRLADTIMTQGNEEDWRINHLPAVLANVS